MNSFNQTAAAIFPMQAMLPGVFPFSQLNEQYVINLVYETVITTVRCNSPNASQQTHVSFYDQLHLIHIMNNIHNWFHGYKMPN